MRRPGVRPLHVAEHDRGGRAQADAMGAGDDVQPFRSVDLVRAEHAPHLVIEDFGRRSRQSAETFVLEAGQEGGDVDTERAGAL